MSQVPFQLLELTIVSAQDLSPSSKNLRTYAVIWVNPERKLRTRIDQQGQINPTWNDKFVFRVDDSFLDSDTSFAMIEIYALGWLRDNLIGSIRVLINNLIPPSVRKENASSKRFVALQIRRPSGRPQGILNMGVTLLDNTMRSMPLRTDLNASAIGFQDVTDVKMYKNNKVKRSNYDEKSDGENTLSSDEQPKKVQLWRSLSDHTDITSKMSRPNKKKSDPVRGGSLIGYDQGSVVNGGGSVVNGGGSMVNGSMCYSDVGPSPSVVAAAVARGLYPTQLGPPPKPGSSVLEDWTVEEYSSTEGLKSKIERWRMEIPPIYDHRYQKLENFHSPGTSKNQLRRRRKTVDGDGGGGGGRLFSCFGNAFCCEFTVVCGANNVGRKARVRAYSSDSKISISELDS